MAAARSKQENDTLWELVKRVSSLETKIDELILCKLRGTRYRAYYINQIKKLRVEKQGLRNYIKELETALRLPTK